MRTISVWCMLSNNHNTKKRTRRETESERERGRGRQRKNWEERIHTSSNVGIMAWQSWKYERTNERTKQWFPWNMVISPKSSAHADAFLFVDLINKTNLPKQTNAVTDKYKWTNETETARMTECRGWQKTTKGEKAEKTNFIELHQSKTWWRNHTMKNEMRNIRGISELKI